VLHVDVMDGHFVPNLTIGPPVVAAIDRHTPLTLDCHLMMTNPGDFLEAFRAAGADWISVHVEVDGTAGLLAASGLLETAQMRCSVDPAGKTGDHDEPAEPELRGEVAREASAVRRGVARTDHGDHWPLQQLGFAEHGQNRRRVIDRGEGTRITRLAPADEPRPGAVECGELGLGLGAGYRGDGLGALPPAGETRQHLERGSRRAETAQHRVKADRADRLGAA